MNKYAEINEKLNFLLKDHKINFDDSHLDNENLHAFHVKANELIKAHGKEVPEVDESIAGLQPKLDIIIKGHGKEFDDSDLDLDSLDTVIQKLNTIIAAHKEQ